MDTKDNHIQNLILEGEHLQLDFKYQITDSKRIARSMAAFANTEGGKLLIGVKDNGSIAGIRSDEELHMIEAASSMYCIPPVKYSYKEWEINKKTVVEIIISADKEEKHKAPDNQETYKYFIRVKDKNIVANNIVLKIWKYRKNKRPVHISFTDIETLLLHYLSENKEITEQQYQELAHINKRKAEAILTDFVLLGIIEMAIDEKGTTFYLSNDDNSAI